MPGGGASVRWLLGPQGPQNGSGALFKGTSKSSLTLCHATTQQGDVVQPCAPRGGAPNTPLLLLEPSTQKRLANFPYPQNADASAKYARLIFLLQPLRLQENQKPVLGERQQTLQRGCHEGADAPANEPRRDASGCPPCFRVVCSDPQEFSFLWG